MLGSAVPDSQHCHRPKGSLAHTPHSTHQADSPADSPLEYPATTVPLYHRPYRMIAESGTSARVRPTWSPRLETSPLCRSGGGWKTLFIPLWQDGILLLFQPGCIRAGVYLGDHQPALGRVGRGLRLRKADRSAAGSSHPLRPHPGNERRELQAQAQPGKRCLASMLDAGQLPEGNKGTCKTTTSANVIDTT